VTGERPRSEFELHIELKLARSLVERARAHEPREACGLLLGRAACATRVVEVENLAAEIGRFEAHPGQWRAALDAAVREGEVALAAWHSHVGGAALPGLRDVDTRWKELPILVVAPAGRPRLRAWRLVEGAWRELALQIGAPPSEEAPTPSMFRP